VDGHRTAERRSIAYHRLIAQRLTLQPGLVERAQQRAASWTANEVAAPYIAAWRELLALPLDVLELALVEDTERMRAMRQVSPFAGALSPRERWAVWRATR
jgi:hypothetical protein